MASCFQRSHRSLLAGVAVAALLGAGPLLTAAATIPAQAQAPAAGPALLAEEYHVALEPFGEWLQHPRWGEVWRPANVEPDWRPYTLGNWQYTDEWGWYWVSDEEFGWITYHYGRWALDRDLGWIWVPGEEWGPAWVSWRRGDDAVGWAPMPPDELIAEEEPEPEPSTWVFVRQRDFVAPRIRTVILPPRETTVFIRRTVIVNRTVVIRGGGPRIAVNAGIPPAYIAAFVGRPIRPVVVRPPILRGTVGVVNAVQVRPQRGVKVNIKVNITETRRDIRPIANVPPPRALERGQAGRLGDEPPKAARGATRIGIGKVDSEPARDRPDRQQTDDRRDQQRDRPAAREEQRPGQDAQQDRARDRDRPGQDAQQDRPRDRDRPAAVQDQQRERPGRAEDRQRPGDASQQQRERPAAQEPQRDRPGRAEDRQRPGDANQQRERPAAQDQQRDRPAAVQDRQRPDAQGGGQRDRPGAQDQQRERPAAVQPGPQRQSPAANEPPRERPGGGRGADQRPQQPDRSAAQPRQEPGGQGARGGGGGQAPDRGAAGAGGGGQRQGQGGGDGQQQRRRQGQGEAAEGGRAR